MRYFLSFLLLFALFAAPALAKPTISELLGVPVKVPESQPKMDMPAEPGHEGHDHDVPASDGKTANEKLLLGLGAKKAPAPEPAAPSNGPTQADWKDVDFTCETNADCMPMSYRNCCAATACVNMMNSTPSGEVRIKCDAKKDCKAEEQKLVDLTCACVEGACNTVLKGGTKIPPARIINP